VLDLRYEERFYFSGIVDCGSHNDDFGDNYGVSISNNGVSKALLMYFADYGKFPAASGPGEIMIGGAALEWGGEFIDGDYIYMKVLPRENKIGASPYCYKVDDNTNPKKYALFTMLENTVDSECHLSGEVGAYSCGNAGDKYCFSYVSPNTSLSSDGTLQ